MTASTDTLQTVLMTRNDASADVRVVLSGGDACRRSADMAQCLDLYRSPRMGGEYVMRGGKGGTHRVSIAHTDGERLAAHWLGYCQNAGL